MGHRWGFYGPRRRKFSWHAGSYFGWAGAKSYQTYVIGFGRSQKQQKKALLHSVAGTVAGGWMFCCIALNTVTRAAAFGPVVSPLPSKGQLDSIRIDASTLDGKAPEQYINKTLESAGGSVSLIVNGTQHSVLLG